MRSSASRLRARHPPDGQSSNGSRHRACCAGFDAIDSLHSITNRSRIGAESISDAMRTSFLAKLYVDGTHLPRAPIDRLREAAQPRQVALEAKRWQVNRPFARDRPPAQNT